MSMNRNAIVRNVFALCAAAMVAVMAVAPCLAAESEAGRYQWQIVPRENVQESIYVIDTETGVVARWERSARKWFFDNTMPDSLPDWNDIWKQREDLEKQKKEARAKREALLKSFSEMSLEEQVAWAKNISVGQHQRIRLPDGVIPERGRMGYRFLEYLKRDPVFPSVANKEVASYKATDDGVAVRFNGMADGSSLEFSLSHTQFEDRNDIFPAPETIIEDVKAEIKRQAEKQKEGHAENH